MIYFTADLHYKHDKEFIWKKRGFSSIEEHDEKLLYELNNLTELDTLYILGDVSFGKDALKNSLELLSTLRCMTYVIRGNHDKKLFNVKPKMGLVRFVDSHILEETICGQKMVLSHYPLVSWHQSHYGSWHIHGHVHGQKLPIVGKMLDVAPTAEFFGPYSFYDVEKKMKELPDNWDLIEK